MSRERKYDYSYSGETSSIKDINDKVDELEKNPPGGTSNYEQLTNKPKINGEELSGDKEGSDFSLMDQKDTISLERIDEICQ